MENEPFGGVLQRISAAEIARRTALRTGAGLAADARSRHCAPRPRKRRRTGEPGHAAWRGA